MKNNFSIILLIFFFHSALSAQSVTGYNFYNIYEKYKEPVLTQKRVNPDTVLKLINKLKSENAFKIFVAGYSLEERPVHLIKYGEGETKVLLWTQMHGDESTATQALFDIFNFLLHGDDYAEFREMLRDKLTLYFIPMLNPDGAFYFTRRNALGIDLNREALRLQFPEAKLLKKIRDKIKPEFGFNLHDQQKYYSAGNSFKSAAISFLAPAFNYKKEIDGVRERTMKVIVDIKNALEEIIPGHIGRYNDDFEPRAFGDNMVKWGTSSILIESGGWRSDEEKQFVRKLNFIALLSAFQSIATESYNKNDIEKYFEISHNEKYLFDLILRNVTVTYNGAKYLIDIAVKRKEEELGNGKFYYDGNIEDIGDLSVFYGYEDIDCKGLEIHPGKIYKENIFSFEKLNDDKIKELISEGYTHLVIPKSLATGAYSPLPINLTVDSNHTNKIKIDDTPNFYLEKKGKIYYVIVNGFLYNTLTGKELAPNGKIFGE